MKLLLPYYFKKIGLICAPICLIVWVKIQRGLGFEFFGNHAWLRVLLLVITCFGFLFGMYFIAFSKEKNEDEFINDVRLKSFQFAAFFQLVLIIASIFYMGFFNAEPNGDGGLVNFLLLIIFSFWLSYIFCFNFKMYKIKKQSFEK